jgi:hypothetical protein
MLTTFLELLRWKCKFSIHLVSILQKLVEKKKRERERERERDMQHEYIPSFYHPHVDWSAKREMYIYKDDAM